MGTRNVEVAKRRILRQQHAMAPRWMTPEHAIAATPMTGDLLQNMEQRRVRILLLCAIARSGLRDLTR